jgi:membrane protein YqaA with SNARE-associated domain
VAGERLSVFCTLVSVGGSLDWLARLVESATGWGGFVVIAVYSFLIAFLLPLPSEVVLAAPIALPIPRWLELLLIIFASGAGKAAGSVFAFHIGHEAKQAGPVERAIRRLSVPIRAWSRRQAVRISKRYGYVGLAAALSVPGFPDTISIYAFSVLGEDYYKFAVSTFVGSANRLLVTLAVYRGTIAVW